MHYSLAETFKRSIFHTTLSVCVCVCVFRLAGHFWDMVNVSQCELSFLSGIRVSALQPKFPKNSCDEDQDEQKTTQHKRLHRGHIYTWNRRSTGHFIFMIKVRLTHNTWNTRLTLTSVLGVNTGPSDWSVRDRVRWCNIPAHSYRSILSCAVLWYIEGLMLEKRRRMFYNVIFLMNKLYEKKCPNKYLE